MPEAPPAELVVIVVFDGLRPDAISHDVMSHLTRFIADGLICPEARSVFPSYTRVASTSISTGALPGKHGIIGNSFFNGMADPNRPLELQRLDEMRRLAHADAHRRAVTTTTLADVLARHDRRLAVVHGGSAGAAYVWAPDAGAQNHVVFSAFGPANSATPAFTREMEARFGPAPSRDLLPLLQVVDRISDVLIEHVITSDRPDVAVAWFPEPDMSYHHLGIWSEGARRALSRCDLQFDRLLDRLNSLGLRDRTAIFVLSDHGQITVTEEVAVLEGLTTAGLRSAKTIPVDAEGLLLTGVPGVAGELRVRHGGASTRDRAVAWLQDQPFIGSIFTADSGNGVEGAAPGTFSLHLVGADHRRSPDIAYTLRSFAGPDPFGRLAGPHRVVRVER